MALVGYKKVPTGPCIYANNLVILHLKVINNFITLNNNNYMLNP